MLAKLSLTRTRPTLLPALLAVCLLAACGGGDGGFAPDLKQPAVWPEHGFTDGISQGGFTVVAVDETERAVAALTGNLELEITPTGPGQHVAVLVREAPGSATVFLHLKYDPELLHPTDTRLATDLEGDAVFLGLTPQPGVVVLGLAAIGGLPVVCGDLALCEVDFATGPAPLETVIRGASQVANDHVTDLHFKPAAPDTLGWTNCVKGDYSQDSFVTVGDITPIGVYFDYNNQSPDWNLAMVADGSNDGYITVGDLSTVGQNYGEAVTGYKVQTGSTETGPFSGEDVVPHTAGVRDAAGGFRTFSFQVSAPVEDNWYIVWAMQDSVMAPTYSDPPAQYHAEYELKPPENLVAAPYESTIRLTWDAPAGVLPDGYYAYISDTPMTVPADGLKMQEGLINATTFDMPALFGGNTTEHYFGVVAVYGAEQSVFSNIYHYQPGTLYPPQNLTAAHGGDHIQLDWEAPASGTPDGYDVYIADNPTLTGAISLNTATITALTFSVQSMFSPEDSHYFAVKALYGAERSDYSNICFYQPPNSDAPNNLTAVNAGDHIQLAWLAPADGTPEGYNAYVADNSEMTFAVRLNVTPLDTTEYSVSTAISPDQAHYFAVSAQYGAVESAFSNIFHYDPAAETDPPVWNGGTGIKSADAGDTQVTVEWYSATDAESPPVTYLIYYAPSASFDWSTATVLTSTAPTVSRVISGLYNGTAYEFGVRCRDNAGNTDTNTNTLIATPSAGGTPVDDGVWQASELVDDGGILPAQEVGWFTSIDVKADGTIGVAHFNHTSLDLLYSERPGGASTWSTVTVASQGEIGTWCSMAFHPVSGQPCIAYHNASDATLEYATRNGADWEITTVDSGGDRGAFCSLAFDPGDNNPAISYWDTVGLDVKYAKFNGTSWTKTTAYNGSGSNLAAMTGMFTDLAFNPITNRPGIAFLNVTEGGLSYNIACWITEYNGTSWTNDAVYRGSNYDIGLETAGWANSIVYSSAGQPYVLTVELTGEVCICDRVSGEWAAAEVGNAGELFGASTDYLYTDMVWHNGAFHWVYYSLAGAVIYGSGYAGYVLESGNVGGFPSVALDSSHNIHVSYFNDTTNTLRYAFSDDDGDNWDKSDAVSLTNMGGTVGERASLEYHPSGYYPMISYYDASHSALKYADKQPGSWRNETVRDVRNDGSASEMGITAAGQASIGYFSIDAEGGGLYVANGSFGAWTFDTVQEFDLLVGGDVVGNYCSLAVNYPPDNSPGVAYYNASQKRLEFQQGDGTGGYEMSIVDIANDAGRWSSAAYNPASKLAGVAYYTRDVGDLYFAQRNAGGEWASTALVDANGQVGNHCSLAYSATGGKPWVSYYDDTNRKLKVAYVTSGKQWNEAGAWAIVDIAAPGGSTNYGSYSCIAWHPVLDRPAVAFYDSDNSKLWYVFIGDPAAPQAAVEVVGGTNAEGVWPSLVFNPDTGEPGIAYHDATNADLRYVKRVPLGP